MCFVSKDIYEKPLWMCYVIVFHKKSIVIVFRVAVDRYYALLLFSGYLSADMSLLLDTMLAQYKRQYI